jgi:DNA-binding XRE family transcriptional regulator
MTLNKNLKKLRKAAGLSQQTVAETLNIKPNTYGAWEADKTYPSAYYLPQIACLYNVTINDLFATEADNSAVNTPPPI